MSKDKYTIEEHQHRLACWAASRSAAASPYCRFSVETGNNLLKDIGISEDWALPATVEEFEKWHEDSCKKLMDIAQKNEEYVFSGKAKTEKQPKERFAYGVAAKLINCYIKVRFVHPSSKRASLVFIHPPIDRLLLSGLYDHDKKCAEVKEFAPKWKKYLDIGWSNFQEEAYKAVIDAVKSRVGEKPLWTIERYWEGMQK